MEEAWHGNRAKAKTTTTLDIAAALLPNPWSRAVGLDRAGFCSACCPSPSIPTGMDYLLICRSGKKYSCGLVDGRWSLWSHISLHSKSNSFLKNVVPNWINYNSTFYRDLKVKIHQVMGNLSVTEKVKDLNFEKCFSRHDLTFKHCIWTCPSCQRGTGRETLQLPVKMSPLTSAWGLFSYLCPSGTRLWGGGQFVLACLLSSLHLSTIYPSNHVFVSVAAGVLFICLCQLGVSYP